MGWHEKPLVYVIYDESPEELAGFFERFGLTFKKEKHGEGPEHYAAESAPSAQGTWRVLEIYPKKKKA